MSWYELLFAKERSDTAPDDLFTSLFSRYLNGGVTPVTSYTITNNLTNVTTSNEDDTIIEGESYFAILTVTQSGTLDSVSVYMGGDDITSTAWDSQDSSITIDSVTGNLVITASASVPETYSITNDLWYVTNSNEADSISKNTAYSATLSMPTGGTMDEIVITMGGDDITSTAWNSGTGAVYIASVTGNITITATASVTQTISVTWSNDGSSTVLQRSTIVDATDYDCYITIPFEYDSSRHNEGAAATDSCGRLFSVLYDDSSGANIVGYYNKGSISTGSQPGATVRQTIYYDTEYKCVPKGYYARIMLTNSGADFQSNAKAKEYWNAHHSVVLKSLPRPSAKSVSNGAKTERDLTENYDVKPLNTGVYG